MNRRARGTFRACLRRATLGPTVLLCLLVSAGHAPADEPKLGDSEAKVRWAMGEPRGRMESKGTVILTFDQGMVVLKDDKVVSSDLVSFEEARRRKEAAAALAVQRRADQERERDRRVAAAAAEKAKQKEDAKFRELPPQEQITFWKDFQEGHPDVSVAEELAPLEQQAAQQARERERHESQAAQTNRVTQIEQRLDYLNSLHGLSVGGLIHARREIEVLRKELEALKSGGAPQKPEPSE
jgi:hypothetical protein